MDSLASQVAEFRAQVQTLASLPSLVAQLASANEAQQASIAHLKTTVQDQDRVIGELVRASSKGGFWIWESEKEGKEEGGRWCWSLEKYRLPPPAVTKIAKPPTCLESLPTELLDTIVSLLPRSNQLALGGCSFKLLQIASRPTYGTKVELSSEKAVSFVSARLTESSESSPRIRSLLFPPAVELRSRKFHASDLSSLRQISADLPTLAIDDLTIYHPSPGASRLRDWSPLLRLVNPRLLTLNSRTPATSLSHASTFLVSSEELAFADRWNRLASVATHGLRSIPMLYGNEETFAFSQVLLPPPSETKGLRFKVVQRLLGEEKTNTEIQENGIASHLTGLLPADPARSMFGAYLYVSRVTKKT